MLGLGRFKHILNDFKPDKVLLFQDIFNIDMVIPMIRQYNKNIPIATYFPIDGTPVNRSWAAAMLESDQLITYTKWGIEVIKEALPELKDKHIDYLYHGVDFDAFNPIAGTLQRRFKEQHGWKDKFVVFSNNRFQPRKVLPLVLRSFILFNKGYKVCTCGNIYLHTREKCDLNRCDSSAVVKTVAGREDSLIYLHCNTQERMMGPGPGNSLQAHLMNAGFVDTDLNKIVNFHAGVDIYENPLSESDLNILYNCADVNISSAVGEGFGLSLGEAAATGTTNIAPNNSAIPEVLGDINHIVPNTAHFNMGMDSGHMRPLVSIQGMIDALEIEYQKWLANGKRKVVNEAAITRAKEIFQWEDKRAQLKDWLWKLRRD